MMPMSGSRRNARSIACRARRAAIFGVAGALLLGLAALFVEGAAAADHGRVRHDPDNRDNNWDDDWDNDWDDAWEDYNRTLLQLQRESISSQEEQAREAERAVRRQELEQNREKSAAEREAYFQAILEASQASLRAPRGVHYRKPGYTSSDPPGPAAATVEVGGAAYVYDRGIFWIQQGTDYLVVTAPADAVVSAVPPGAVRIPFKGASYWYFFGTFFSERNGTYTVVKPPAGLTVYYLPDGYSQEKRGAADVFRFGETLFKPVFVQGVLAYQVVAGE